MGAGAVAATRQGASRQRAARDQASATGRSSQRGGSTFGPAQDLDAFLNACRPLSCFLQVMQVSVGLRCARE